jgi:hypothetical protein
MPTNTTSEKVQAAVIEALATNAWFASNSITCISEDQLDTPESVETYLASPGAVVIVGQPSFRRTENGRVGISVPVEIYENPQINRITGGTGKKAREISENVFGICEQYQSASYPQFTQLQPTRLEQIYADDGLVIFVVDVESSSGINPTQY